MNASARFLTRSVKNVTNKSLVKVPWLTVVITRLRSRPHKMEPLLQSALNMGVSITKIVTALQTFSANALLLLNNVKCDVAAKIYAMKVTWGRRLTIFK